MRYISFDISNYKGIESARVAIPNAEGAVVALIGLNESGKTTLLEAISHFHSEDEDVSALYPSAGASKNLQALVPKGRKANFTGAIKVTATIQLSALDVSAVHDAMASAHNVYIDKASFPKAISVTLNHDFKNSVHSGTARHWPFSYHSRAATQRKFRKVGFTENNAEWNQCIKILTAMFPKICYFPSFQFDFPERIYFAKVAGEAPIQSVYRSTIEDVLKHADKTLNIQTHVVERIKAFKEANKDKSWKELYADSDTKSQVDAVLQKIENEIGKSVFTAWNEIFPDKIKNKLIGIELRFDYEKDDAPYIVFSIKDGPRKFSLGERSLGFRWFFSFLLFTRFRKARGGAPTLFVFDEPASNLHARAQMKLLESFSHIVTGESSILYSTHSQYMIDPLRLDQSYIVQNLAIDFDAPTDFDTKDTNIKATLYRTFVGKNPDKGAYFQPVLDKIGFVRSPLEIPDNVVVAEGKGDFIVLGAAFAKLGYDTLSVFPSAGATTMATQIAQCIGFGKKFVVLCDDDKEGKKAVKDYRDRFYLSPETALTYGDVDAAFAGYALESFVTPEMKKLVEDHFGGTTFSKSLFVRYFQEASVNPSVPIAKSFLDALAPVASKLAARLA